MRSGGKSTVRSKRKRSAMRSETETDATEESCSMLKVPVVGIIIVIIVVCFAFALLGAVYIKLFLHNRVPKKHNLLAEQVPDETEIKEME